MAEEKSVKPYFLRVRNWKIRNMVMMYLEARERFLTCRRTFRKDFSLSFETLKEMSDILFEIKENHHLIFKRVIDPEKGKFEKSFKITPDEVETEFMNNIGLLFHKIMVTRELKYLMDHYVEDSAAFQRSSENLQYHILRIDELFTRGIEIIKSLLGRYKTNILLLTYLLDDPARVKRHFGQDVEELLEQFVDGRGLDEVYYSVGKYYLENGWPDKAKKVLKEVQKRNPQHELALAALAKLN